MNRIVGVCFTLIIVWASICNADHSGKVIELSIAANQSKVKAELNSTAVLTCMVNQTVPSTLVNITWSKGDEILKRGDHHYNITTSFETSTRTRTTLQIHLIDESDYGTYNCTASIPNENCTRSASIELVLTGHNSSSAAHLHNSIFIVVIGMFVFILKLIS